MKFVCLNLDVYPLEDICKYMCEKFHDIWANISAQIASEVFRILGDSEAKINSPIFHI